MALAAVVLDAVVTVVVAIAAPDTVSRSVAAGLGCCSLLLLGPALLLRQPVLVAPAAAFLGAAYAATLTGDDVAFDLDAPLVAVALLLVCELGYWAHELRTTSRDEPGAYARHAAWLGLLGMAVLLPGVALLALADLLRVEGIAVEAIGVLAVGVLIAGLLLLVRNPARS